MYKRGSILVFAALLLAALPLLARMDNSYVQPAPQTRLLTAITDEPAWFWMIWWVDAGNVSDITISNTLQGGVFPRGPNDMHPYQGLPPQDLLYPGTSGHNFEYPKGSQQYYGWAWGLWLGSKYPVKTTGGTTVRSPNVTKCAFYTDLGAMSAPEMSNGGGMHDISNRGLYFSDMVIPDGYGFEGVGGELFAQSGSTPLAYQTLWPFADTSINERRRKISMPTVDPTKGDIISMQDTYACGGDWIPAKDAAILWIRTLGGPYDVWGQGVRIEQRTYAWNYDYNNSYVFINYKIQNMNNFTLDSVYLSFFMDNDIGQEGGNSPGQPGAWDDLIGFDKELNLGYTYDSDGSEPGWVTPAGYIGCVLLETPKDASDREIGLTGFETWQNGHEVDEDGQDSLKYAYMKSDTFVTWEKPNDVRMLLNCGPYLKLEPYETTKQELSFTVAVIVAYTLDELKEKVNAAKIQFDNGYFGYAPPPNPSLTVLPGDSVVYLTWSSTPERYRDPMSEQYTFEGYRVYRSLSGISETWNLLADYDLRGSANIDTAVAFHSQGTSKSTIEYKGIHTQAKDSLSKYGFATNAYTITFRADSTYYTVFDVGEQKELEYNSDTTKLSASGYTVLDSLNGSKPRAANVAQKAKGAVNFYGTAGTVVPKNTKLSTEPTFKPLIEFVTTKIATLDSTGTAPIEAAAVVAGTLGNVGPRQINTLVSSVSGVDSVINEQAFSGGVNGQPSYPYHSGDVIFINGAQYVIADGVYDSLEPGAPLVPRPNEQFLINTYAREELGSQNGIRHYYMDEDVRNGQIYYYCVTSYSRPQPTEGVGSLEGGKTGKTYWAIPRSNSLGWQEAWAEPARRISGTGNALVKDSVVSSALVTGHEYEVGFRPYIDTVTKDTSIRYAYFKDVDSNYMVLDSFIVRSSELSGPIIDGVLVQVAAVSMDTLDVEEQIDSLKTGWLEKPSGTNLDYLMDWLGEPGPVPKPIDVLLTVVKDGKDSRGQPSLVSSAFFDNGEAIDHWYLFVDGKKDTIIRNGDKVVIFYPTITPKNQVFTLNFNDTLPAQVVVKPPKPGDKFLIKTLRHTTTQDKFRFLTHTSGYNDSNTTRTLADIRVIPNPYYIRAQWDRSQYDRHVYFQNLPLKCTIRIFNSAGLLIRTIEHDGSGAYGEPTGGGSEAWNLRTQEDLDCTSGLYIWQVQTEDGKRATGKFAIVR